MGLVNTRLGIILPMIFSPFGVVVMHQYMKSINNSVIEAMRLETSSVIRIIISTVIPQIKIYISAVLIYVFADCWNMLEQPMLFTMKLISNFIIYLVAKFCLRGKILNVLDRSIYT